MMRDPGELQLPANQLGLAAVLLDARGRVKAASQEAERLWGSGPGGLIGRQWASLVVEGEQDLVPTRASGSGVRERMDVTLAGGATPGVRQDLVMAAEASGDATHVLLRPATNAGRRAAEHAELERLQHQLAEAEAGRRRAERVRRELVDAAGAPEIVGSSAPMLTMLERVRRVAPVDSTVLIIGETGSGKELVARRIHVESARAGAPMIAVNCAAMPDTLIESELFGHERGAFTGADRQRLGKFELADGGTLFLDEVAELSPAAQAKLLRVLQDGSFERVGGVTQVRCDVRVVAATHRDLAQQVRRGRFREDLFYRLSVFRIDVPALRDRKEDIRALVEHLHVKHALRMGRPISIVNERSLRRLFAYRWPGNVRELENTVERATLLADPDRPGELDIEVPSGGATTTTDAPDRNDPGRSAPPRDVLLDLTHDQLQRLQIMHALESSGYRVYGDNGAAKKLDIKPQTLLSRMDKLGIPRPRVARGTMRRAVREGNNG